ncbi:MAG: hypothetical protein J0I17_11680 ['Candidatus Kapabacteria' thiocyanatum]|uniref:Uncharacterized protein n=1 Tax=Candidatus Kapaibacterium thiocyanatum TaxID=1895771 RepID=A0A1M3KZ34_9BACT|nr:hypothetical protein ['Candidatus Kapabacteria' thiocyanatum]OJX57595.1 MAG: hypothetical protein BGO89_06370 ['Candidatus Kapabacteria' thiocyanatum]
MKHSLVITCIVATTCAAWLGGCGSSRPTTTAPCIGESLKELVIRWGTEHDSISTVEGYELTTKGEVFRFEGPKSAADSLPRTYLGFVDQAAYCEEAAATKDAFLKTQALNVRGIRGRFVEYVNPRTGVYLRVVWNPDLQTFQSRDFRAQYEALMQLVPAN